jgi:hypothetical protein
MAKRRPWSTQGHYSGTSLQKLRWIEENLRLPYNLDETKRPVFLEHKYSGLQLRQPATSFTLWNQIFHSCVIESPQPVDVSPQIYYQEIYPWGKGLRYQLVWGVDGSNSWCGSSGEKVEPLHYHVIGWANQNVSSNSYRPLYIQSDIRKVGVIRSTENFLCQSSCLSRTHHRHDKIAENIFWYFFFQIFTQIPRLIVERLCFIFHWTCDTWNGAPSIRIHFTEHMTREFIIKPEVFVYISPNMWHLRVECSPRYSYTFHWTFDTWV